MPLLEKWPLALVIALVVGAWHTAYAARAVGNRSDRAGGGCRITGESSGFPPVGDDGRVASRNSEKGTGHSVHETEEDSVMTAILQSAVTAGLLSTEGSPCVLVVDDEDALRTILTRELRKRGFDVYSTDSGAEAVEMYCRSKNRIDLVLMDVNMPGMSGPDALAALRADDPGARCCFMTADPRPATWEALLTLGAVAVFGKPFPSLTELCESLRRYATRPTAGMEPATQETTRWTS